LGTAASTGTTVADAVTLFVLMAVAGFNVAWALEIVTQSLQTARQEAADRRAAEEALRREIANREKVEDQLRQAQKMEAVGRLAGGVAHDFNNLLTAIIGLGDLVMERTDIDEGVRRDLQQVRKAALQAAAVTQQLLAFSRKQVLQARVLDANAILRDMEPMVRRLIGEDVALELRCAPSLASVFADQSQLQQIVMNLVVNARDAMPDGGRLTIETANVALDSAYVETHPEAVPGRYVQLAISDTGVGMDKETQRVAFEPFFTTKGQGKGTGLGLATVHGIVKQSGGSINLYSEPGKGTTFRIYFPVSETSTGSGTGEVARTAPALRGGSETVLLVEDEELIIGLAERILLKKGYRVLKARQPEEALAVCREYQGQIDLLVTDVIMPGGMSGRDLARVLVEQYPALKVLYVSGYTDNAIVHHGVLDPGVEFLPKPFSVDSLSGKVREVLDKKVG
jgi:signal transduction histidine kinase/ActR/RegA family two-component response regulator